MKHEESTKVILHKVRSKLEYIRFGRDRAAGLHLSPLQARDQVAQATKRCIRSRAAPPLLSAAVTLGIYCYCAPLAYIERGGKTAYGGECLVALTAGFFTYLLCKRWFGDDEQGLRMPR